MLGGSSIRSTLEGCKCNGPCNQLRAEGTQPARSWINTIAINHQIPELGWPSPLDKRFRAPFKGKGTRGGHIPPRGALRKRAPARGAWLMCIAYGRFCFVTGPRIRPNGNSPTAFSTMPSRRLCWGVLLLIGEFRTKEKPLCVRTRSDSTSPHYLLNYSSSIMFCTALRTAQLAIQLDMDHSDAVPWIHELL